MKKPKKLCWIYIYIYIYYNYKQFPEHLCVFWFGAPFYRTSISSACCHYWCPCCKLENIYNIMLIYWLLSCQLFLFWGGGVCRLLLALPLLQIMLMSILHKREEWNTIHEAGNPLSLATSITDIGKGWTMNHLFIFIVHPFPILVILVARGRGFPASRMVFHSFCLCRMEWFSM